MPKKNFTVRISEELRQWLEAEAEKQNRSIANLIIHIITERLKEEANGHKQ